MLLGYMSKTNASDDRYDAKCQYQNNTIILDYDGEKFKGYTMLPLKNIISTLCFDVPSIRNLYLNKIIIIAKSKRDYGAAKLQIGRHISPPYILNDDYRPVSIWVHNHRNLRSSRWKLYLEGKIKVKKLIIKVEELN